MKGNGKPHISWDVSFRIAWFPLPVASPHLWPMLKNISMILRVWSVNSNARLRMLWPWSPQFKTVKPNPDIPTAEVSFNFPGINFVRSRDFNLMLRKKWNQSYHNWVGGNVADKSVEKWKSSDLATTRGRDGWMWSTRRRDGRGRRRTKREWIPGWREM